MRWTKALRSTVSHFARRPLYTLRILMTPLTNAQLKKRWSQSESLLSEWDGRTQLIAKLIPNGSKVIEFGAGRMVLKPLLGTNCVYQPSDIVDRGRGTLVLDLNVDRVVLGCSYSHAVFSGVLEYVRDIAGLIQAISPQVSIIIASYSSTDAIPDIVIRLQNGWVSHLSDSDFLNAFIVAGYDVGDAFNWREQKIYVFRKRNEAQYSLRSCPCP